MIVPLLPELANVTCVAVGVPTTLLVLVSFTAEVTTVTGAKPVVTALPSAVSACVSVMVAPLISPIR